VFSPGERVRTRWRRKAKESADKLRLAPDRPAREMLLFSRRSGPFLGTGRRKPSAGAPPVPRLAGQVVQKVLVPAAHDCQYAVHVPGLDRVLDALDFYSQAPAGRSAPTGAGTLSRTVPCGRCAPEAIRPPHCPISVTQTWPSTAVPPIGGIAQAHSRKRPVLSVRLSSERSTCATLKNRQEDWKMMGPFT